MTLTIHRNIGNARVLGMEESIELVGNQYNIALMIFFFPYALLEVPANLLLKKLKPSVSTDRVLHIPG